MKNEKIGLITFDESEVDQIEGISGGDAEKVCISSITLIYGSSSRINEDAPSCLFLVFISGYISGIEQCERYCYEISPYISYAFHGAVLLMIFISTRSFGTIPAKCTM